MSIVDHEHHARRGSVASYGRWMREHTVTTRRAWVRARSDALHDVICDHCGTVAWGIKRYKFALQVAANHHCEGEGQ